MKKAELPTWGLLLCWLTNKSSFFVRYQQWFGLTEFYSTLVLIFIISIYMWLQFRAGHYKIPAQQQALLVVRHANENTKNITNQN